MKFTNFKEKLKTIKQNNGITLVALPISTKCCRFI